jgi:hypothetical protein
MSSEAPKHLRKKLRYKRARRPTRPARGQDEDIELVTKGAPKQIRQPSLQKEPPRPQGP